MLLYKSVRFSRSRSSPVIIPPSFVATIFLRSASTAADAARSRFVTASEAGNLPARSSSAWRTPFMRSTANVMSPSVPLIFSARSSDACRSACVWVPRGSGTSTSCVVNVAVSLVSLIVYVPGRTRGPNAAPNAALAAGGTRGGASRIDHVARFKPRRLLVGIVPTSFPLASYTSSFMSPKMCRRRW